MTNSFERALTQHKRAYDNYAANQRALAKMYKVNQALEQLLKNLKAYNNRQKNIATAATLMKMSRSPQRRSMK